MATARAMGAALLAGWAACAGAQTAPDPYNPKPAEGDFALPMPGGGRMVFRPVFLRAGDPHGPFSVRRVKVGDAVRGGFREHPAGLSVGGAFLADQGGKPDWMFYLGKYEVTEAQFDRVMKPGAPSDRDVPKTQVSWFDVQDFLQRYNLWLLANAAGALPRNEDTPGFVRLPTEIEWEFAARGGAEVTPEVFDAATPYGAAQVNRHEYFFDPASTAAPKGVGRRLPNPLGLHDMLGNVAEFTDSRYQVEYVQGHYGGIVARGGHFMTAREEMRSSLRDEKPPFRDGKPAAQADLGFRLAIGSVLYAGASGRTTQRMRETWERYAAERIVPGAGGAALAPTTVQTSFKISDAAAMLDRLEASLKNAAGAPPAAMEQVQALRASFGDVQTIIRRAETDSAQAWTKMASYTAWFLSRELAKVETSRVLIETAEQTAAPADEVARYRERHQNLLANIRDAGAQYGTIQEELGKIVPEQVRQAFGQYEARLVQGGFAEQLKVHRIVVRQYGEYAKTQRLDLEKWKQELLETSAKKP